MTLLREGDATDQSNVSDAKVASLFLDLSDSLKVPPTAQGAGPTHRNAVRLLALMA